MSAAARIEQLIKSAELRARVERLVAHAREQAPHWTDADIVADSESLRPGDLGEDETP